MTYKNNRIKNILIILVEQIMFCFETHIKTTIVQFNYLIIRRFLTVKLLYLKRENYCTPSFP